ncbi:MAG TPA: hypothetical protein VD884_17510 [Ohtaekwangia sp.]|nr:hypothetical protein [Ohtaekwangia sp.]
MKNHFSNQQALEMLNEETLASPDLGNWGIATKDSMTSGFQWFHDNATLLQVLQFALPFIEQDSSDIEDLQSKMEEYESAFQAATLNDDFTQLIDAFNKSFSVDIEVIWIGSFDELLRKKSNFANFVREEFHGSTKTITQRQLKEFKEILNSDVCFLGMYTG